MASFGPAAEVKEFGVSLGYDEPLRFRSKWLNPLTPRSAILQEANTECRKAGQLAGLKQGPPMCADVCP